MKQVKIFGKSISVVFVVLMVLAGIAGAAFVHHYFMTAAYVTVKPPLSISPVILTLDMQAGETISENFTITNHADVPITFSRVVHVWGPFMYNVSNPSLAVDGIVVEHFCLMGGGWIPIPGTTEILAGTTITISARVRTDSALIPGDYTIVVRALPILP